VSKPRVTVWDASVTLGPDGRMDGPMTFMPVAVDVDEAADLADDLLGGPLVCIALQSQKQPLLGSAVIRWWALRVRAFIETDAYEALYEAERLLSGTIQAVTSPLLFRLRDGELVP
jgi:hypothetical protein